MEYQMMRQNIFENRKRQTPKMTFVFVLKEAFASFLYFLYPHLSIFRSMSCDKHGEGCLADISAILIDDVNIDDTSGASLMDTFSFDSENIP